MDANIHTHAHVYSKQSRAIIRKITHTNASSHMFFIENVHAYISHIGVYVCMLSCYMCVLYNECACLYVDVIDFGKFK